MGFPVSRALFTLIFLLVLQVSAHSDVVINEIHYHPEHDCEYEEFIELFNTGGQAVLLSGWQFREGISFTFPQGTELPANGYLLLARNPDYLRSIFPVPPQTGIFAFTSGTLSNDGEDIVLVNEQGELVDRVDFNDRFPWPVNPDGGGPSLECINPFADNGTAADWKPAVVLPPSWKSYSTEATIESGTLRITLNGPGEYLIDDISLKAQGSSTELIVNGDFESPDLTAWQRAGNHADSMRWTEKAYDGTACLKVRAEDAGDDQNAVMQSIDGLDLDNTVYILSFQALRITDAIRLTAAFPATSPVLTESRDIGDVARSGSTEQNGNTTILRGSGSDIWSRSDEFHYNYTEVTGDAQIESHVAWQQAPNSWSKAGVMIRETVDANSKHAMAILSRDNGTALQYRSSTGNSSSNTLGPHLSDTAHLRLRRNGNNFTAEVNTGGWQEIGQVTIDMNDPVLIGIMVTAHDDGEIARAAFQEVLVNGQGAGLSVTTQTSDDEETIAATPGLQNSQFALDSPPYIHKIHPLVPTADPEFPYTEEITQADDVHLTAMVEDDEPISSVSVFYQVVDPGAYIRISDPEYITQWTEAEMNDDGTDADAEANDGIYTALIPRQGHRSLVRYRIQATAGGETTTVPSPDDPQPNLAYFVYDGIPDYVADVRSEYGAAGYRHQREDLTTVPVYHLICKEEDLIECEYKEISFGNKVARKEFSWQGTFIYDPVGSGERKVYDNIVFRLRGGVWRYTWPKRMYKIKFLRGHHFRGHYNHGVEFNEPRRKANLQSIIDQNWTGVRGISGINESLAFRLFRHSQVASPHTTYIHFRTIVGEDEQGQYDGDFKGLFLDVEQPDSGLLETSGRPSGNLYKMDSGALGQNGGRPGRWDKEETDCSLSYDDADLDYFYDTYNSGTQTVSWWESSLDLDRYYSYRVVLDSIKHYDIQAGKNYYYYHNSDTNLWEVLPWDTDLILGGTCCGDTTYGEGEPFWKPVIEKYPGIFGVAYRNRFREYLQLLCNRETLEPLVNSWFDLILKLHEADRDRWDYFPLPDPYPYQGQTERNDQRHGGYRSLQQRVSEMWQEFESRNTFVWNNTSNFCGYDAHKIPAQPMIIDPAGDEITVQQGPLAFRASTFSDPDGDSQAASLWQATRIYEDDRPETIEWPDIPADELAPEWFTIKSSDFTTIEIPECTLSSDARYLVRVRYEDATGRMSLWSESVTVTIAPSGNGDWFVRGDANMDGTLDLSDPITVLLFLFSSKPSLPCDDAADANDDGIINLADAVAALSYLFRQGNNPPAPFPLAGADPTDDDILTCAEGLFHCADGR